MTTAYDWTGAVGDIWAREWRRTDRSFADLSRHLDAAILAAAPTGNFRALDIGCGAGGTTLALATGRPDAEILGVDLSEGLVAVARARASHATVLPRRREPSAGGDSLDNPGLPPAREHGGEVGVTFLTGDAITIARRHAPFDLLYSRHGVMFFDDPVAAFAALRRSASPGARLVFSCFRDWALNAFASEVGVAVGADRPDATAPGPFAFADRDRVAAILADAGCRDAVATPVDFAYRAGEGDHATDDALSFFQRIGPAAPVLRAAAPGDRPAMLERLAAVIESRRARDAIDFPAAAWIWSATA